MSGQPGVVLATPEIADSPRQHPARAGSAPLAARAAGPSGPGHGEEAEKRRRLLVVDDEDGPRQALQIVFQEDYEVLVASSGREALDILAVEGVDAAILDIRMAGMTGIELLQRIKAFDPRAEILMLTAYGSMETARQAIKYGACDYILKPFEVKTLRQAVAAAMSRRSLNEEVRHTVEKLEMLQSELQNQQLLQEIARGRGEIYASVIHDIKGPLTVISGYIQLVISGLDDVPGVDGNELAEVKSVLRLMTRQVTNCIEISQRYLSFLRRQPASGGTVRAGQILADLSDLVQGHPGVKGHDLQIIPLPEEMLLRINGTDLIQILLNLIINGCQSTPAAHKVRVWAQTINAPLTLKSMRAGDWQRILNVEGFNNVPPFLAFEVEDNGPGIPPEILDKIFQPYFTTKSPGHGTGLGLSIVLRLVREAGALLTVTSKPGEGTVFTIVLPAINARAKG